MELLFTILYNVVILLLCIALVLIGLCYLVILKYYYLKAIEEEKKGNDKNERETKNI